MYQFDIDPNSKKRETCRNSSLKNSDEWKPDNISVGVKFVTEKHR